MWMGALAALARVVLALFVLVPAAALASDKAQLFVSKEDGFGRLIIDFPSRLDLPAYRVRLENGVLAVEFEEAMTFVLPDVAVTLPDYITIARIDPDKKGVRFGLRTNLSFHTLEAGEKLFVDLLPKNWQGLPPGLPPEVVAELSARAKDAALRAEQQRKAEEARSLKPAATVRVGRNPTFMRIEIDWSVPTRGTFGIAEGVGNLDFDWPVAVDLYALKADLPAEVTAAENVVGPDGSRIALTLAEGVTPRFYQTSDTQFIIDIDLSAEEMAALPDKLLGASEPVPVEAAAAAAPHEEGTATAPAETAAPAFLTPTITTIGDTLRISFPFDRDTAAAAFQRGGVLWLLFDTPSAILTPSGSLGDVARSFTVTPEGGTQIVRIDLAGERLATLAVQGRSWVVSLGNALLEATEPLPISRRRDDSGQYQMLAEVARPGTIHQFRDPVAGDELTVVTAFGPARGVVRTLDFVDVAALRTAQGLVVQPLRDGVGIALDGGSAVISAPGGLALSSAEQVRTAMLAATGSQRRETFIDLAAEEAPDPVAFSRAREQMIAAAAEAEGPVRDAARLRLAQFYLSNRFAYEAIGVLRVMQAEIKADDLRRPARLAAAVADVLAYRPREALETLSSPSYAEDADALLWRTIARSDAGDYEAARVDGLASEAVLESYPRWVRHKFLFAAIRAALETNDFALARRYLGLIEFSMLEPDEVSWYQLFSSRLAEAEGNRQEALDGYGQVIASDVRPARAEAVYRTVLLLDRTGEIDLAKASETLQGESMMWRGDRLEADMQRLLAELYFRHRDYRLGFETVRQAVLFHPDAPGSDTLLEEARVRFEDLFLNGVADALEPVDALSLYYDFRQLTPAGARGDEMIRNLARRLVRVDLLNQAADLLEYQIDERLKGVAQAQVATDLAVIRLAAREPEAALRVLNRTRLAELSPQLERQRRILEARALIDAGRQDLAIDLLRAVTGRDADLLRVEGLWKSGQYVAAGELIEVIYSSDQTALANQPARMNIVKAAIGMVLGGDRLGLQRLRGKFGERMAQTPEWPLFDFVTGEVESQSVEFRKVAREVSGIDSLDAFLTAYRALYSGSGDPAPQRASPPRDEL